MLVQARSVSDLDDATTTDDDGLQQLQLTCGLRPIATQALELARRAYVSDVRFAQEQIAQEFRGLASPSQDDIANILLYWAPADHRERLDGRARYMAHVIHLAMAKRHPYDPEKHPTDALDAGLIQALSLPAYICTLDGRFRARVRASGAKYHERVLDLEHLLEKLAGTGLEALRL